MAFSVGGLASGLDTQSIIQQLMQIDARPKTQLEWKSQLWTARKSAWSDLNTKLQSLQTQANVLMRPETWDVTASTTPATPGTFTATSGDPSRLSATTSGTPTPGTYAVEIYQLSRAEVSTSSGALDASGLAANDTLTITTGSGSWNVALAAGDQKQDIVDKINATSGAGVLASLVDGEVQLRSTTSGAASAFNVTSTGTTAAMLGFVETQSAQDAQYSVNGTTYSSANNMNVTGPIPDVALNLTGTTSTTLTIAEGSTTSGGQTAEDKWVAKTMEKLSAFVDSYNSVIQFVHQKTQAESRVTSPKNLQEYLQGPMARDVGFSQVALDLRRLATDVVSTLPGGANLLSDIGITSSFTPGGGGTNGTLAIDKDKLETALRADPAQVQKLLAGIGATDGVTSDDGVLRKLSETVSLLRVGGKVDNAMQGASSRLKSIQDSIDRASERLERRQAYYDRMFASMETVMGRYQEQTNWLSGQFAALSGGGK